MICRATSGWPCSTAVLRCSTAPRTSCSASTKAGTCEPITSIVKAMRSRTWTAASGSVRTTSSPATMRCSPACSPPSCRRISASSTACPPRSWRRAWFRRAATDEAQRARRDNRPANGIALTAGCRGDSGARAVRLVAAASDARTAVAHAGARLGFARTPRGGWTHATRPAAAGMAYRWDNGDRARQRGQRRIARAARPYALGSGQQGDRLGPARCGPRHLVDQYARVRAVVLGAGWRWSVLPFKRVATPCRFPVPADGHAELRPGRLEAVIHRLPVSGVPQFDGVQPGRYDAAHRLGEGLDGSRGLDLAPHRALGRRASRGHPHVSTAITLAISDSSL